MLKIISLCVLYLSVLFTLFWVPDKFWDKVLLSYQNVVKNFVILKKRLPLLGEIYRGEELLLSLTEYEARIALGIKILSADIPKFKFYTELLEQLFLNHRKLGIGIKKFLPELRLALINDLQFEKKILEETASSFLQFLVIATTTWSFVFLSKILVHIPLYFHTVFGMIILQMGGTFLFFKLLHFFKKRKFASFSSAIEEMYLFTTLMDIGLPLNEVLLRSAILQGSLIKDKRFNNLGARIKKLINRMKETGLSPKEESNEIIKELWHLQNVYFIKFTKLVQVLKFCILTFFFLPAYFLYLSSIFQFFMEQ